VDFPVYKTEGPPGHGNETQRKLRRIFFRKEKTMKKNSMRFLSFLLLAMMMVSLLALGVLAEGEGTSTNVAKIGDVGYESLSAALGAAESGDTAGGLTDRQGENMGEELSE
jgi:hypothetical protein